MKLWSIVLALVAMVAAFAGVYAAPEPNPEPRVKPGQVLRGAQLGAEIHGVYRNIRDRLG